MIRKNFRYYLIFRSKELQSRMSYKYDFFMFVFSDFITQISGLIFIEVIFLSIPNINGYGYGEVLFIYGLFSFIYGVFALLFWPLYDFSSILLSGEFDSVLLRPISPLLQSISKGLGDIGGIIVGIMVLWRSISVLDFTFESYHILILLGFVICGVIILLLTYILIASLSFYLPNTMGRFIEVVNHGMNFSKYPITIYPKIMRILLLYLIPIGVISFIPTTYIFKLPKDFNILLIGFSFISYTIIVSAIWKKGVRSYKGVGNYE